MKAPDTLEECLAADVPAGGHVLAVGLTRDFRIVAWDGDDRRLRIQQLHAVGHPPDVDISWRDLATATNRREAFEYMHGAQRKYFEGVMERRRT